MSRDLPEAFIERSGPLPFELRFCLVVRGGRMGRIGKRVVSYAPVVGLAMAAALGGGALPGFVPPALGQATCTINGNSVTIGTTGNDTIICGPGNALSSTFSFTANNGNDNVTLNTGATLGEIRGGFGNDTITLNGAIIAPELDENGAPVNRGEINGQQDNDTILLNAGSVYVVTGFAGNDTITLNGATVTGQIDGGAGDDVIVLAAGLVDFPYFPNEFGGVVYGGSGADTITLSGATVTGDIFGDTDIDTINLLSGSVRTVDWGEGNESGTLNLTNVTVSHLVFGSGVDSFTLNAGTLSGNISLGDATYDDSGVYVDGAAVASSDDDVFTMTGGRVGGTIHGDFGKDTVSLSGGTVAGNVSLNSGSDTLTLNGGAVTGTIFGGNDADLITLTSGSAGTVDWGAGDESGTLNLTNVTVGNLTFGAGADSFTLTGGTVGGNVNLGDGAAPTTSNADIFAMTGGTVLGIINGDLGNDTVSLSGGTVSGSVILSQGNDRFTLTGTAQVTGAGGVNLGTGDDTANLTGGSVSQRVDGSVGNDTITLAGAVVGSIAGGADADQITLTSGSAAAVMGDQGNDTIALNGATVTSLNGGADADQITLTSGSANTVSGDAGADTITLNGAAVTGGILGGDDADSITLISGSAAMVDWGAGDESGTLNLTNVTVGNLTFGAGADSFTLTGGTVGGNVNLGDGDVPTTSNADIFTMTGGSVSGAINGDLGNDTVSLSGGAVSGSVSLSQGNDRFTLTGTAQVTGAGGVSLGTGNDTANLTGGVVTHAVSGDAGNDTFTLNGASVGSLAGGADADLITLTSGSASAVNGDAGTDSIVLNGATLTGTISGGDDADTFTLTSGSATTVNGDAGNDTFTLNGATAGSIAAGADDDLFNWLSGTVASFLGGDGSDTATVSAAGYTGAQLLDGGAGGADRVYLQSAAFDADIGATLINWEEVHLASGSNVGLAGTLDTGLLNLAAGSTLRILGSGLGTGTAGDELVVTGNFAGGGTVVLDVALAGNQQADRLVVNGNVTGQTTLVINNTTPGVGNATTGDGILLVDVGGTAAADAFTLSGPLVSGAFEYTLDFGGASDADQNFYLVSIGMTPEGAVYQAAPGLVAQSFADLPGLVKRHSGRLPAGGGAPASRQDAGLAAVSVENAGLSTGLAGGRPMAQPGPWVQIEAGRDRLAAADDSRLATDRIVFRAGFDADAELPWSGQLVAGGYVIHARASDEVESALGTAGMTSEGYGFGATATYFAAGGTYLDLQGLVMRVESDLDHASGVISTAAAASAELGHVLGLGNGMTLIPSAQLQYGAADAASFEDDLGNRIRDFGDDELTGRLGVALEVPVVGGPVLTASLDYLHEFAPEMGVRVGPAEIGTELAADWLEAGLGLDWQLGDAAALMLRASYATALGHDPADNTSLTASATLSAGF